VKLIMFFVQLHATTCNYMPDLTYLLHPAAAVAWWCVPGAGLLLSYDLPRTTSSSKMQQQQQTAHQQQQQTQLVNSSKKQQPAAAAVAQPQEPAAQRRLAAAAQRRLAAAAAAAAMLAGSSQLSWMQDKTRTQLSTRQQCASSHALGT
jgi:hypothetical protein